jgi:prepilin-type N-terminal cleavage/methylation domain-containing protein
MQSAGPTAGDRATPPPGMPEKDVGPPRAGRWNVACCPQAVAHRTPRLASPRFERTRARRGLAGFTLIEIMIVVCIIGISAALVAPAMMRTMGIARANRCQYDAARMFRSARANAIGTGRAHLVHATTTAGDYHLEVYVGDSSSCARSSWGAIVVPASNVSDSLWEQSYTAGGHGVRMEFAARAGLARPQQVCFEPQGERFERAGTTGVFTRGAATLTFTIDRLENGAVAGDPQRRIILPQFGTPRVYR